MPVGLPWATVVVALTSGSVERVIQLLAAAVIPVGLLLVVTQTRTVRWTDLLLAVGVFVFPFVVILRIQGMIPVAVTMGVFGFVLGHVMEMLDDD